MSSYVTTTDRLALRCDSCGCVFHPRAMARSVAALRAKAWRQGWRVAEPGDRPEMDYCSRACALAKPFMLR